MAKSKARKRARAAAPEDASASRKARQHWATAFYLCSLIFAHLVVLLGALAAVGVGAIAAWKVAEVVAGVTGQRDPVYGMIRWGAEIVIIAVVTILVVVGAVRELAKAWRNG